MGEYDYTSEIIKWRLVGTFNETTNSLNQFVYSPGVALPSADAVFLLDTFVDVAWNKKAFYIHEEMNEYADPHCDIRQYIIGEGEDDFVNKLNIDTRSFPYDAISPARDLSYSYRDDLSGVTATTHQYNCDRDLLWLLSYYDACKVFNNSDATWESSPYTKSNWVSSNNTDRYWLCSPENSNHDSVFCVEDSGNYSAELAELECYVRPAFVMHTEVFE